MRKKRILLEHVTIFDTASPCSRSDVFTGRGGRVSSEGKETGDKP